MGCLAIFPILEIYNIYNLHQNLFNQDLDFSFLVQQYYPYLLYTSCIPLFYHFSALVRIRQTGSLFINRETVTLSSENTETIFPMQVQCASYVRKYVSKAEKVRSGPKKMLLYEAEKPRGQGRAILEWGG